MRRTSGSGLGAALAVLAVGVAAPGANAAGRPKVPEVRETGPVRGARDADVVAAIVTLDDPAKSLDQNARYGLAVNGVPQPGG